MRTPFALAALAVALSLFAPSRADASPRVTPTPPPLDAYYNEPSPYDPAVMDAQIDAELAEADPFAPFPASWIAQAPTPTRDPSMDLAIAAPSPSPSFTPIPPNADPASYLPLVPSILAAIERKDYAFALGLALMIATALVMKFGPNWIPKDYMATALLACTVLGGLGAALASGVPWKTAVLSFLFVSSTAVLLWEAVGKHLVALWGKITQPEGGGP